MTNRLAEFIKKSGYTVQQVADLAGLTRDSVNRLKAGQVNLNEEKLYKFSKIFNCYPSELLTPEWQKPSTTEVNTEILAEAITQVLEGSASAEDKEKEPTLQQKSQLIALWYKEKIKENKQVRGEVELLNNK